jgi:2-polyprenyl-3-methyl-5-hydroxy-6-metoxy-1,4-benzoquinol methylase
VKNRLSASKNIYSGKNDKTMLGEVKIKIQDIQEWWNNNSYSYGINSNKKYKDVGVPPGPIESVITEYERKYKKHLKESCDNQNRVGGLFIPYDSIKDGDVLDVACGLGWASINLALNGCKVQAIDLTPNAVSFVKDYAKYKNLNISVSEMSAEELKFETDSFDFVLGWGFIMHTENPEIALNELIRVVKPRGKIVIYFYYKHSISYWWNIFFLRGVLMGYLLKYRWDTTKLVSRFTDGQSFGGNSKTLVLTRSWFNKNVNDSNNVKISFSGWGPPSLIDSFPISKIPLGKLLPNKFKKIISRRFGFGHICIIEKQ